MTNKHRLDLIKMRNKRYGMACSCPICKKTWWHEDEDYIVSAHTYIKKLQCPYCEVLFEAN